MTARPDDVRADRPTEVYRSLRNLIVHGRLAPGTRILETEIANRLNVSRTPVRSALHRLQQEGYVIELGGSARARLSVAPLTKEDGSEIFHIVAHIEGLAVRYAAGCPTAERTRLAEELGTLNANLRRAAVRKKPDSTLYFELDSAFHRSYVEASGGRRLIDLHNVIKPQADRYAHLYTSFLADTILTSAEEHDVIVTAIQDGEPDHAQRAVETNWRNAAERLAVAIDRLGERGSW